MRRVGAALGIRAPSLYKHLAGRPALELALVEDGLARMGTALHRSVDVAPHARITSLLDAYRATGLGGPELYRLATSASFPRAGLPDGLEAWAGEPFFLAAGEPYLAQALWSFAHGTMLLELDRRFLDGSEVTRTWEAGAGAFEAARQALAGLPAQPHVR
jgi:AcrR family transcriptional regulator